MLLKNTFEVPLSAEDTWRLLTDLPRIAPCLPGAHLDEVVDGQYHGKLSARIGPVAARYAGTAQFLERDEVAHRAVIAARGREERGSGSAQATITASLHPEATGTRVDLATEIAVSGRAAQFGRSLLADVSSGMISDFARRLEALIAGDTGAAAGGAGAFGPAGAAAAPAEASLDVVRTVALPVARRVLVPLASAVAGGVIGWLAARWRGRAAPAGRGYLTGRGLPHRWRDAGRAADRFDDVGQVEGDQCAPQMGGERLGGPRLVA
jgi:uncharacterized protein